MEKICSRCQNKNPNDSAFCTSCGAALSISTIHIPIRPTKPTEGNRLQGHLTIQKQADRLSAELQQQAALRRQQEALVQERIAAEKAAEKKKVTILVICVLAVIAVLMLLIGKCSLDKAHNAKLRNFAAEEMNDDYTNVYADVVSIDPQYFVYKKYSSASFYNIDDIICKCKTVEGKTIWVSISAWNYPGGNSYDEESYETLHYSSSKPMHLTGTVDSSESIIDELSRSIGNVFVLDVYDLQEK